jgi:hypothetical protein
MLQLRDLNLACADGSLRRRQSINLPQQGIYASTHIFLCMTKDHKPKLLEDFVADAEILGRYLREQSVEDGTYFEFEFDTLCPSIRGRAARCST